MAGRLFTYNFDSPLKEDGSVSRNYYDVGAIRFPDNPVMERYVYFRSLTENKCSTKSSLFQLLNYLEMHKADDNPKSKLGDLLPYYIKGDKEPWHFNGTTKWGDYASISAEGLGPWKLNEDDKIPEEYVSWSLHYLPLFHRTN